MRSILTILILILPTRIIFSQQGFSQWIELGQESRFVGLTTSGHSLIAGGGIALENQPGAGLQIARIDTAGNVVHHFTLFDSLGTNYSFRDECEVNQLQNGNYSITGDALEDLADIITVFDQNDDLVFHREYPYEDNIQVRLPYRLISYEHGHIWLTADAFFDFDVDIGLHRIDPMGNKIWTTHFGVFNKNEIPSTIIQIDNFFLIGGYRETGSAPGSDGNIDCRQSWIFAVDSTGNKQWEWLGEPCSSENVYGLQQTPDGGYIYLTRELEVYNPSDWGFAPKIVRRDADFNLLWERKLADSYFETSYAYNLHPSPDGNWVAVGNTCLPEPCNPLSYPPGAEGVAIFLKVSDGGNQIWRTSVPTPNLSGTTFQPRIGGSVMIGSGSTFAAGSFRQQPPDEPTKSWAWLIKVDNNGCAETFCEPVATTAPLPPVPQLRVYPNPSPRIPVVFASKNSLEGRLEIFDATGKRVLNQNVAFPFRWDTAHLPVGVYVYRVRLAAGTVSVGKVVLQ